MINGLGVVGWGVGGIEAEAGMLGQPLYFVTPDVIGFKLTGSLSEGATATDLALTVTQMLRKKALSANSLSSTDQVLPTSALLTVQQLPTWHRNTAQRSVSSR